MIEEFSLPLPLTQATGSQVDLAGIVETYAALLFRVAHSVLRNRAEAEDVLQDVFLRVLEHRSKLSSVRDLRLWLIRVTWNLSLDRRRCLRPDQLDDAFATALVARTFAADQTLQEFRRLKAVLEEIDRLPKAERQALLLSALEELETADVAQLMKRSEAGVRALLFRARARLRERLSSKGYA